MTKKAIHVRFAVLVGIAGLLGVLAILPAAVSAEEESVTISGSTTVLPIAAKCAEAFMSAHPDSDIRVSGGGSGAGITAIGEESVDIGMASRDLTGDEQALYPDLILTPVARDGVAVIVNPENPVESLSLDQIRDIYAGSLLNWKDLGGETSAIEIVGRDSASGTREFFYSDVMKKTDFTRSILEKNSNGAIQQFVSQTPAAIGYVGMGFEDGVKVLDLDMDGKMATPTADTVKSGAYPLSRELYVITSGEPDGSVKEFIDFILSAEGQKIVEEEGFVPVGITG